ncbi:MAG: type II toxin-antitoxin system RelE/ParE family toxin [Fidelibacterota bacterium]
MPRLYLTDDQSNLIRKLHRFIKKRIRTALSEILKNPHSGKFLRGELEGFLSYCVSKIRIIYRLSDTGNVEVITIGPLKTIYKETYKLLKRERNGEDK